MKKLLLLLLIITFFNCETDDISDTPTEARWNLEGFDRDVINQSTQTIKYVLHFTNGVTETQGNTRNIDLKWTLQGRMVVVNHDFEDISKLTPMFFCDNNVLHWLDTDGTLRFVYAREGYNISNCNTSN